MLATLRASLASALVALANKLLPGTQAPYLGGGPKEPTSGNV